MQFIRKLLGLPLPAIREDHSDRLDSQVTRDLTPQRIDAIMQAANSGDVADQCRLCREILEKNFDIIQAVQTRKDALLGLQWSIEPGDETPEAKAAADSLKKELERCGDGDELDTFEDLMDDLMGALLPGFAVSEIVWINGGHIAGFKHIPQRFWSFQDGFSPKLITTRHPLGIEVPRRRIIFHRRRFHGSDPVRGGLVRPLAWLHCFANVNHKDLLAFIERYGMPFLVAKVDDNEFETQKNKLRKLIRNFGSGGGGLFTKAVELEMLQAAQTTGDVYFRLLEYLGDAVNRIVLGQTASSGDSSGLSGGDAQSQVRQDILCSDARWLERGINAQIFKVWGEYNFPGVQPPRLKIQTEPAEDLAALATTVSSLYAGGLETDPAEMSERFGIKLTRRPEPAAPAMGGVPAFGNALEDESAHSLNLKQKYDAMGVAIRAGLLTATPEIEEQTRQELGLPPLPDAAKKAWEATGGIRQPITLKAAEAEAVNEALDVDSASAPMSDSSGNTNSFAQKIYGKCADALQELTELEDPEMFEKRLSDLIRDPEIDTDLFAAAVQKVLISGYLSGLSERKTNRIPDDE